MTVSHNHTDSPNVIPGIVQASIFMVGAVVYGIMTVSAGSPLLWALYVVLLFLAVALSVGVLRFRIKREPKPRWIIPLASAALIVAIIFGAAHTALGH
ncbi:hypothetical protein AB4Y72_14090 [Arthrobacter sp. YAF34]|uniref:hypothetical protein n=1 Tax=Arthrobacter sp. YAF34 TaxID=3233083 RepID=UPI003F8E0E22